MIRVPRLETAVIGACVDIAADASSQVVIEPLTLLESSANPEAAPQIIRFLVEALGPRTLEAAWWAAAEKMTRSHFSSDPMAALMAHAVDIQASPAPFRIAAASAAASVMRRAPAVAPRAVLDRILRRDALASNVFSVHQTASREEADTTADPSHGGR